MERRGNGGRKEKRKDGEMRRDEERREEGTRKVGGGKGASEGVLS